MLTLVALASLAAVQAALPTPAPAPLSVTRRAGEIALDGDIGDPGWAEATRIDTFYETVFGDDRPPHVATVAWVTYDDEAFWFGVRCDDPSRPRSSASIPAASSPTASSTTRTSTRTSRPTSITRRPLASPRQDGRRR